MYTSVLLTFKIIKNQFVGDCLFGITSHETFMMNIHITLFTVSTKDLPTNVFVFFLDLKEFTTVRTLVIALTYRGDASAPALR
jgi:hypothetical protein